MYNQKGVQADIQKLVDAAVIDNDTARSIQAYYSEQEMTDSTLQSIHDKKRTILTVLFSVFGALCVGVGIVLIFAHNWDILPRGAKISIAFVLLVTAQILCGVTLIQKKQSFAWREGSVCFLLLSLGASIAFISQIYHIPADLSQFLFIVLMLILPVLYIFRSPTLSLFFIVSIIWFLINVFYDTDILFFYSNYSNAYKLKILVYLIPLVISLPFYIQFQKSIVSLRRVSFIVAIQNWGIVIACCLGVSLILSMIESANFIISSVWVIGYSLFFQILYLFGSRVYSYTGVLLNAYKIVGMFGMLVVAFYVIDSNFYSMYNNHSREATQQSIVFLGIILVLSLVAHIFIVSRSMYKKKKENIFVSIDFFAILCMSFLVALIMRESAYQAVIRVGEQYMMRVHAISTVIFHVLILMSAMFMLLQSVKKHSVVNIRQLNFSVCIICIWIVQQFLNTDFSYFIRGIVFIILGIVFLQINIFFLRAKERHIAKEV